MTAEVDNYLDFFARLVKQVNEVLHDLPPEALNWRPRPDQPGADAHATNSPAATTAHLAGSVRYWVGEVAGGRPAHRDRDAEFRTQASDAGELTARVAAAGELVRNALKKMPPEQLDGMAPAGAKEVSRRNAVVHALQHASIHLGHLQLTRQLWEASRSGSETKEP